MLKDVPHYLPALMRSAKVQKKAASAGFDWDNIDGVFDKINEEISELREALAQKDRDHIEEEVGDLLFAAVNASRFSGICAETALSRSSAKFIERFSEMEKLAAQNDKKLDELDMSQLEELWQESKKITKKQ